MYLFILHVCGGCWLPSTDGVRVTLNSDNLLLSGSHALVASPVNEVLRAVEDVGLSLSDVRAGIHNGLRAGFSPMAPDRIEDVMADVDAVLRAHAATASRAPEQ